MQQWRGFVVSDAYVPFVRCRAGEAEIAEHARRQEVGHYIIGVVGVSYEIQVGAGAAAGAADR